MEEEKKEIIEVQKVEENTGGANTNQEATKKYEENNKKGLCIAAMVLGIIALVLFCVWYVSIPCAILAIIFGIVGIKSATRGMAIAGLVTGSISIIVSMILIVFLFVFGLAAGLSDVFDKEYDRSYYRNYSRDYSYNWFD